MAKIFRKNKAKNKPSAKTRQKEDLMDPVLYNGGLDKEKYPNLPLSNEKKEDAEIENPLNKR